MAWYNTDNKRYPPTLSLSLPAHVAFDRAQEEPTAEIKFKEERDFRHILLALVRLDFV